MSNSLDLDALDQRTLPTFNPERLEFTVAEGRFLVQRIRELEQVLVAADVFEQTVWEWISAEPENEQATSGAMDAANEALMVLLHQVENSYGA